MNKNKPLLLFVNSILVSVISSLLFILYAILVYALFRTIVPYLKRYWLKVLLGFLILQISFANFVLIPLFTNFKAVLILSLVATHFLIILKFNTSSLLITITTLIIIILLNYNNSLTIILSLLFILYLSYALVTKKIYRNLGLASLESSKFLHALLALFAYIILFDTLYLVFIGLSEPVTSNLTNLNLSKTVFALLYQGDTTILGSQSYVQNSFLYPLERKYKYLLFSAELMSLGLAIVVYFKSRSRIIAAIKHGLVLVMAITFSEINFFQEILIVALWIFKLYSALAVLLLAQKIFEMKRLPKKLPL